MKPKVILICDGQFGSTGKGLIAGYLAKNTVKPDTVMCAFAPNAGHTYIDKDGRKWVHRMIPNGIVSPNLQRVMIGPGAVVDIDLLDQELELSKDLTSFVDVVVHEHAAVVHNHHQQEEAIKLMHVGSTMKGTAAANIEKMMRKQGDRSNIMKNYRPQNARVVSHDEYCWMVDASKVIQLEGAQGYSLGIQSGIYPYVTSRECTPAQMLSDCAIPINYLHQTVMTLRTYPIRVANRFDKEGNQIGTSGPGYLDQQELSWDSIGREPELTTVTKLPRRLFSFSKMQYQAALRACAPDFVFLNFANYIEDTNELIRMVEFMDTAAGRPIVKWLGHGPTENGVFPRHIPYQDTTVSVEEANKPVNQRVIG